MRILLGILFAGLSSIATAQEKIPVPLRWAPHLLRMHPMLRHYLSSVVKGFEWYLTRGEPVPRNQWGAHAWFSTPQKTSGK